MILPGEIVVQQEAWKDACEKAWLWEAHIKAARTEGAAIALLRQVYDHGENSDLHEQIRVYLESLPATSHTSKPA